MMTQEQWEKIKWRNRGNLSMPNAVMQADRDLSLAIAEVERLRAGIENIKHQTLTFSWGQWFGPEPLPDVAQHVYNLWYVPKVGRYTLSQVIEALDELLAEPAQEATDGQPT